MGKFFGYVADVMFWSWTAYIFYRSQAKLDCFLFFAAGMNVGVFLARLMLNKVRKAADLCG